MKKQKGESIALNFTALLAVQENMNEKLLGEKIAEARKAMNLTQADLANAVAMSAQNISKWERGESMPDCVTLYLVAKILKKDIKFFYGESEEEVVPEELFSRKKTKLRAKINESYGKWKAIDFAGTKMANYDFKYARFDVCDFRNADLSENAFPYSEFYTCDLTSTNFNSCEIVSADYVTCNLQNTNFSACKFKKTNFTKCSLNGVIFDNSTQENTGFYKCELSNIKFADIDFNSGYFEKSTINNCAFINCTFNRCMFKQVLFQGCKADKISYNFLKVCGVDMSQFEMIE